MLYLLTTLVNSFDYSFFKSFTIFLISFFSNTFSAVSGGGAGLIQLSAIGPQDFHLTANPQITYFKVVYRRHTNFSIECVEQVHQGKIVNGEFTLNYTIKKGGDLLSKMHFEIDLPQQTMSNSICGNYSASCYGCSCISESS